MSAYTDTLQQIREARKAREQEKDRLYALQLRHLSLKKQRNNPEELEKSRQAVNQQIKAVQQNKLLVQSHINDLFLQLSPQQLIEEWNDRIPITLFPVRLETKFMLGGRQNELWVRIFPDDIAVVTHEKILTQQEIDFGIAYWKAIWNAKQDEEKKKTAWRMIADKFGANRSAWVAQQTKPLNWSNADILVSDDDLEFPAFDITKPDSWTEAPHTNILPDRFVLMAYRKNVLVHTQIGQLVNDVVILGPAPMEDADTPSITRDEINNRLQYGEDFKWLVDFELAVEQGLGFKVRLESTDITQGFDQLLVTGIKISADDNDAKQLVEDLFNNHHYSKNGLAIVRQGTPTNNTDEEDAGYSSKDPLQAISYFTETGSPLFTPVDAAEEATDGQRLAEYLGIDYAPLQYIANSDARDNVEAVAMNKALFGGTLGYYLNSMLNEVMNDEAIDKLRDYFTKYVTGRGPVAAIRVGKQPYGILPVSAFSKWKYPQRRPDSTVGGLRDNFLPSLYNFLAYLQTQWHAVVPELSHISKQGSASANLMNVLGLQPTSADFYQRIGYSYDYLKNLENFQSGGKYAWDVIKMWWDQWSVPALLKQFGYTATRDNGTPKPTPLLLQIIFQHYHTRLDNKNLIDGQPFSETNLIKPYDDAQGFNYIHWLLNNLSTQKLQQEDFGGAKKPNSLLYMMLRYSLLHETSYSIYHFLKQHNIEAAELIRSRKFANITSAPTVSHWEVFDAPVNKILANEQAEMPLFEYMHSPRFEAPADIHLVKNLNQHKWALNILKDMPTARLERAWAEHMDLLTYRLDAWQTSLFDVRLRQHRQLNTGKADGRAQGVYIGAYGYLENVKPNLFKRVKVSEDMLPEPLREQKDNLFVEKNNGGYVHAPSLNHATAAAILRNGYLTHANPADRELLAVNLSSERVRRAQYLVEGIRNGQTLEALLGYQFERGLHDWTTREESPVILNQLIPIFRQAFPVKRTKVPQEGKTTGPEEVTDDFHVVNGLTLAGIKTAYPYGVAGLPSDLSTDQINAIKQEKTNIENTLDAMKDLLVSESAYQLALGNFDRAAAVMQSISGSQLPPDIEVINSARGSNLSFTNRVVIHFDPTLNTDPWPAIVMTERARTEAGLNYWVGQLLGDPARTRCWVQAVDADGNILKREDTTDIAGLITLAQLNIQPVDLMYLIRNKLEESGTSELEARVRYVFAQTNTLSDATIVKIIFARSDAGSDTSIRSFAEILPFANYIRDLVCGSRTLGARDFAIASKKVVTPGDNPNNLDTGELQGRVQAVYNYFNTTLFPDLDTAVTNAATIGTAAALDELRVKLVAIADAGYAFAFPQSAYGADQEQIDTLLAQGRSLLKRFDELKAKYNAQLAIVNNGNTKPPQKVSVLTEMVKMMLGDDYVIIPRFSFTNTTEVTQSYAGRAQLTAYATSQGIPLVVDEWLHGVSLVRPKMHTFEMIRLLNDTYNTDLVELTPIQLPYRANDSWLAVEYPETTTIEHDTLSFIQYTPQGFDPTQPQAGLLLDEWTEFIPNKEEVTGISFNYNQPNSVPPQAILLTVTPEETGHWTWDDLTACILETFSRARERAVEPDLVDKQGTLSTLLPAVVTEFSTARTNVSLDFSYNIAFVLSSVMALELNSITPK